MGIAWIIFITAIIVFVQSVIFRRWGLSQVTYARYFSRSGVFEGDVVELVERISNPKLLPVPWLRLESMLHVNLQFHKQFNLDINGGQYFQNHKSLFSLMPFTQMTRRHHITCAKRGVYELNSAAMTVGDIMGIQSVTKSMQLSAELLVYPKIIPLEDIPLPSHSWQGDVSVRRWIVSDPFVISGAREYEYGDSMQQVNWKATSRMGRLQVHNRDFTADHRLMIYLNFEINEHMWAAVSEPERIEKAISYAASLAQYALSQGIETGFGCNGHLTNEVKQPIRIAPRNGKEHLFDLLEMMARIEIACSCDFADFLAEDLDRGVTNCDYYILTSFVSEKMEGLIDRLRKQGNAVDIVVLQKLEPEMAVGTKADE